MDDRYESEGRKPERERKVVHFIIQGHWRRRSLCSVFLICYCYCVGGKRMAVYQIYLIFLCVFWRWLQNVSVFHDRCVLISTCVCVSQREVRFWFATGGAGFCLSRRLAEKMAPWARYLYTDTPCTCMYVIFTGRRLLTGTWRRPKLECRLLLG